MNLFLIQYLSLKEKRQESAPTTFPSCGKEGA